MLINVGDFNRWFLRSEQFCSKAHLALPGDIKDHHALRAAILNTPAKDAAESRPGIHRIPYSTQNRKPMYDSKYWQCSIFFLSSWFEWAMVTRFYNLRTQRPRQDEEHGGESRFTSSASLSVIRARGFT